MVQRSGAKENQSCDHGKVNNMKAGSASYRLAELVALAAAVVSLPFSIRACHYSLFLALIFIIASGGWRERWPAIVSHPLIIGFGLFFFLHVIGMLYTEDKTMGWFDIEKKVSLFLLPLGLASTSRFSKRQLSLLWLLFVGTCFIGTLICIAHAFQLSSGDRLSNGSPISHFMNSQFWNWNPHVSTAWISFSYEELASGIGIHPTYFSLYLAFCLLLLYKLLHGGFFSFSKGKQLGLLALVFYLGVFIICLSSRIVTIGFLSLSAVGAFFFVKNQGRIQRFVTSCAVVGSFVLLVFINPVSRYRFFQEIATSSYEIPSSQPYVLSTTIRASLWWLGLKSLHDVNLVWGAGTGDVEKVMRTTGKKYAITNSIGSYDPHNQFLDTLLRLGFIGLIVLLGCFALPAYWAYQSKDFFYLAFLAVFALICLTETPFELQKGIVFFSLFNSLLIFHDVKWTYMPVKTTPNA